MTDYVTVNNERFVLYIPENTIQARVRELGEQINKEYEGRVPIFIGILNGSFIFMSDLIRNVTVDCEIDFMKLSSYGDAKISSGNVTMLKELNCQVEGRDIIIVEDIVDSGLSVDFILKLIRHHNPRSVKVVSLLYKKDAIKINVPVDYIGFSIPKYFVIGYGLDYSQKVRNLRGIYRLADEHVNN
ncbi:MAG: hypoxanthine phosphoribosyltransferase [Ignavibacteriae bacterium]|nr:hypoxanthine phosphoribosyltransferase [Ignavibacteria bacterium]MBI3364812.1 hypoxanthine phosphoribosyltransferase [Ignavibacteriota bacterium]